MTVATKGNLSEVQDTDMIKAVMDLKAKQTAYQAALSAAAKIMKLSLVDYL
jgi:flagellar hook-associated protein 3 FlgL